MPSNIFGTRVEPSPICLGTMLFGSGIDRKTSFGVMDAFLEAGGTFLDTAHIYAAWLPGGWGESERTVGEWLRAHGARDAVVLGTKGGHPPLDDMAHGRCGAEDLEADLRDSLERLQVDYIDLYWLHRDDPGRPAEEIVETLAGFIRDGRIRSFGVSNWTIDRIETATAHAQAHGLPEPAARQPGWALAERKTKENTPSPMRYLDEAAHQWHLKSHLPIAAYSAQAQGYFGGANVEWASQGFQGEAPNGRGYDSATNRQRLIKAMALAEEKGCTAHQIALAYLLNQPFPVFAIAGTGKPERIPELMEAAEIRLAPADLDRLTA